MQQVLTPRPHHELYECTCCNEIVHTNGWPAEITLTGGLLCYKYGDIV